MEQTPAIKFSVSTLHAVELMSDAEMEATIGRISPELRATLMNTIDANLRILTEAYLTPLPPPRVTFPYTPTTGGHLGGWRLIDPRWSSICAA